MAFLVKKNLKGKVYYYLRHNHRVDGKVKIAWEVYLGSEKTIKTRNQLLNVDYETDTIEFGLHAALQHIAEKLNLMDIINKYTNKREQGLSVGDHILIAAINRCVQPTTKNQLKNWFSSTTLKKSYPNIGSALDSRSFWSHFRYLNDENIEKIENDLMKSIQIKFGVKIDDLSFDPTNFYTYINPRDEDKQKLPMHGHSKESRFTLNIINMSLFSTLDAGIPLFHLVYPGNIQDATHFKKSALPALKSRLKKLDLDLKNITLVFDKGNLSQEAFDQVDESNLKYICSDRPSTHKNLLDLPQEDFEMHILPNGKKVGVKEFRLKKYGKTRRFIAVLNLKQAKWNLDNLQTKVDKKINEVKKYFETRLKFNPGEKRRGTADKWRLKEEVAQKIQKMIGKQVFNNIISYSIDGPDEILLKTGGEFKLSISINAENMENKEKTLGKGFLITNREDLTPKEIVWTFRQQYLVERAFKWLKSSQFLSVRPMFHRVDNSVRGHIFVSYIGLLLLSLLTRELIQMGMSTSIYL